MLQSLLVNLTALLYAIICSHHFSDKHQLILEKAPFLIGFSVRASAFETYLSNPRDLRFMLVALFV